MVIYIITKLYNDTENIVIEHINAFNDLNEAKMFGYRCIKNYKLHNNNKIFYKDFFSKYICIESNNIVTNTYCDNEYYCPDLKLVEFQNIVGIYSTTNSDIVFIVTQSNQNTLISCL